MLRSMKDLTLTNRKRLSSTRTLRDLTYLGLSSFSLLERLHALQQKLHGKPPEQGGGRTRLAGSVKDTAALLQQAVGKTSQDLQLARAVKQDPSLLRVKDKRTAMRLVQITAKRMDDEEMAGAADYGMKMNQLFCADSAVALKHFPSETFHVCLTDPPWLRFFDDSLRLDERTLPVFRELYWVMRYDSFLYMFAGLDDYHYYAGRTEPNPDIPAKLDEYLENWKRLDSALQRLHSFGGNSSPCPVEVLLHGSTDVILSLYSSLLREIRS